MAASKVFRCGPGPDAGGSEVIHDAIDTDSKIVGVKVWTGALVAAITVVFKKADGTVHELPALGEPAQGPTLNEFNLDDGEFITAIAGRYGALVGSVRIHTNQQESALFGGAGGTADYRYEAPTGCEICGFVARSGLHLGAIGVLLRNKS